MAAITQEQAPHIIRQLRDRYEASEKGGSLSARRAATAAKGKLRLHDKIAWQRAHFFNMPEVDPRLPKPYDKVLAYQSDAPRQVHGELKARLTENHFTIKATPDVSTNTRREVANDVEKLAMSGVQELEERLGYTFQEALSDGQIIDGLCFLHWRDKPEAMPDWEDYDYRDDLPGKDDKDERKRYRKNPEYTEGSDEPKHRSKYRETDESLWERRRHQLARAPFPYHAEVIGARNVYWLPDRACLNGLGMVMTIQEIGFLEWADDLKGRGVKEVLEDVRGGKKLRIYTEQDAPDMDSPSWDGWEHRISLVTIWTRDYWCEFAQLTEGNATDEWELVGSGSHDWEMPPFAMCTAIEVNDPDPALRYLPALEGVYRMKPYVDEATTYMHILARNTALKWFYLEPIPGSGMPLLTDEEGKPIGFTPDAANSKEIPQGYTLKWVDDSIDPGYTQSVALWREDFEAAKPATGTTDTSGSSQPWTIRLKQAEANVTPRKLVDKQITPLRIFVSALAKDMMRKAMDEPEQTYWRYAEDGGEEKLVGVKASDFKGIKLDVKIDSTSEAERVTIAQLGMEMLGRNLITPYQFWDEFMGDPDPQKRLDEVDAYMAFTTYVLPGLIRQEIAKELGTQVVVGADGELVGPNGQQVSPYDVLAGQGFQQVPSPQIGGQGPAMPGQGTLAVPGTVPVQSNGAMPAQGF